MIILSRISMLSTFIIILSTIFYENKSSIDTIDVLPFETKGNPNSKVMVIFLHGFPNTFRMWDKTIDNLHKDYFCVNLSYPNFSKDVQIKWGMDIIDIVNLIKKTVDKLEKDNKQTYKKVFVAHDWGSIFAYILDYYHPKFMSELVSLDVGAGIENTIKAKLNAFSYQSFLAANFLIGGHLGKLMTKYFIDKSNPYGLTIDDYSRIDSSWNYIYYYFWKRIFYYKNIIDNYEPSVPITYIYGTEKPYMFHNDKFINNLKKNKSSEVHSVKENHWVMNKNVEFVLDKIKSRIKKII
jgi:pimeloyl-ACP methyl ester carboxylesterase